MYTAGKWLLLGFNELCSKKLKHFKVSRGFHNLLGVFILSYFKYSKILQEHCEAEMRRAKLSLKFCCL